jgi:hypothetical protein
LKTRLAEREKRWAAAKLEHPPIHIGLCRLQLLSPRGQENHAKIKQWLYREIGIGPNKEPGGA